MTVLEESIVIISKLGRDIGCRTSLLLKGDILKSCDRKEKEVCLWVSLFNLNILDTCSLIDEYDKILGQKTEKEYNERILICKTICKPVMHEIKKWKDLMNVRNSFIAHNFRLKSGRMFYNQDSITYNVPRDIVEIELLSGYIQLVCHVILNEFFIEIEKFDRASLAKMNEEHSLSRDSAHNLINHSINKVNSLISENKRDYFINLRM